MAYNDCGCPDNSGTNVIDTSGTGSAIADCLVNTLRCIIGDFDNQYSDERLVKMLAASVFYVVNDLSCCPNVKKPNCIVCGYLPADILDYPCFAHLVILKAACLIDQSTIRSKAAAEGIRAVCGSASIAVSSSSSLSTLCECGPCASYDQTKYDLCVRCPIQAGTHSKQIIGAFVSWSYRGYHDNNCGSCHH